MDAVETVDLLQVDIQIVMAGVCAFDKEKSYACPLSQS